MLGTVKRSREELRWVQGRPQGRRMAAEHVALNAKFSAFLWGGVLLLMAGMLGWAWWTGR